MFKNTVTQNKILHYIRYIALKTNRIPVLREFYYVIYMVSLKLIIFIFKLVKPVQSIYLEGSLVDGNKKFIAGSSDIDLIIITKELPPDEEFTFLNDYVRKLHLLKTNFPFLKDSRTLNTRGLCIHNLTKLLGPKHFKKNTPAYKLLYTTATKKDYLPARLNFDISSYVVDEFINLCRVLPTPLIHDLRCATMQKWAYVKNTTSILKLIVEYIRIYCPALSNDGLVKSLQEKIRYISKNNFFIYPKQRQLFYSTVKDAASLMAACFADLIKLLPQNQKPREINFAMTKYCFKNEALESVASRISSSLISLHARTSDIIETILLVPSFGGCYNYMIYLILRDDFNTRALKRVYDGLIDINERRIFPAHIQSPLNPHIITKSMFEISKKCVELSYGPLDLLPFNRNVYHISGELLNIEFKKETIANFINAKLYGRISKASYSYLMYPKNNFELLIESLHAKRDILSINLFDSILCFTAVFRLAAEHGIITTNPLETLTEYTTHYSNAKTTRWYNSFFKKYYRDNSTGLLTGIETEIKELFRFYKESEFTINQLIYTQAKNYLS